MSASDFGFKLSLPGYDVKTASPEQCAVHSSYPPLKAKTNQPNPHIAVLEVDFTATVTQNVTHTIYSIEHGYNYVPFSIANIFFDDGLGTTAVGIGNAPSAQGFGGTLSIDAYCTASHFKIDFYDDGNWTSNSASMRISYSVYAENGT